MGSVWPSRSQSPGGNFRYTADGRRYARILFPKAAPAQGRTVVLMSEL